MADIPTLVSHIQSLFRSANWNDVFPEMNLTAKLRAAAHKGSSPEDLGPFEWHGVGLQEVLGYLRQPSVCPGLVGATLGGSLAKGTAVCPEAADVDIVFRFENFSSAIYTECVDKLERALRLMPKSTEEGGSTAGRVSRRDFYFGDVSSSLERIPGYMEEIAPARLARLAKYVHLKYKNDVEIDLLASQVQERC
mmetsp:Transcript_69386/g.225999  ORF Transcript_69386/g.225999 Transcript_69386/m.225999 type:complete len:194 (-) Transcript_69386:36-617(-)